MKGRKISEYPMTVYVWFKFLQKFNTDIWNAMWCNYSIEYDLDWRCVFLGQVRNLVSFRVLAKVHPESLKNWNRSSWRALLPEPVGLCSCRDRNHMNLKYPKVMAWTQKCSKREASKALLESRSTSKTHNHHQSKTINCLIPHHLSSRPSTSGTGPAQLRKPVRNSEGRSLGLGVQNEPRMRVWTILRCARASVYKGLRCTRQTHNHWGGWWMLTHIRTHICG